MQANTSTYNLAMLSWFIQGIVGSLCSCWYCLKSAQKVAQETQENAQKPSQLTIDLDVGPVLVGTQFGINALPFNLCRQFL